MKQNRAGDVGADYPVLVRFMEYLTDCHDLLTNRGLGYKVKQQILAV